MVPRGGGPLPYLVAGRSRAFTTIDPCWTNTNTNRWRNLYYQVTGRSSDFLTLSIAHLILRRMSGGIISSQTTSFSISGSHLLHILKTNGFRPLYLLVKFNIFLQASPQQAQTL